MRLGDERDLRFTASVHKDFDVPRTDRLIVGFGQTQPASEVFEFSLQDRRRWVMAYTDRSRYSFADVAQVRASFRTYTERRRRQNTGSCMNQRGSAGRLSSSQPI